MAPGPALDPLGAVLGDRSFRDRHPILGLLLEQETAPGTKVVLAGAGRWCPLPGRDGECSSGMDDGDRRLLADPAVRSSARAAWLFAGAEKPLEQRQETGFFILEGGPGQYETTPVQGGGEASRLLLVMADPGDDGRHSRVAATFHTHPLGGEFQRDPVTGAGGYWLPCHSEADRRGALSARTASYVLTRGALYRYRPGLDAEPVLILCGGDLARWLSPETLSAEAEVARARRAP